MNEMIRILQDLPRPLDGGENLGRPDVAVRVGVDEREALRVELDPGYRTGEGHPEFLVQRLQRRKVGARLEEDLVDKHLVLHVSKDLLRDAPGLDKRRWQEELDTKWLGESSEYFGFPAAWYNRPGLPKSQLCTALRPEPPGSPGSPYYRR